MGRVLGVALIGLVSVACTARSAPPGDHATSPRPSAVAPGPLDAELAMVLPESLPGYRPAGPPGFADGPLDLRAAAALEHDAAAEEALLSTRGFLRGFIRSWTAGGQLSAVVSVYEFGDAVQASAYVRDGEQTLLGRGATRFSVGQLAGASGFSQADDSGEAPVVVHIVAFVRDARAFLVVVSGPRARPDDARAVALIAGTTTTLRPTRAPT